MEYINMEYIIINKNADEEKQSTDDVKEEVVDCDVCSSLNVEEECKNDKQSTFEEWEASLRGMSFEDASKTIRDKILESEEIDTKSKKYFKDAYDYVLDVYKRGKSLDTNLFKIHMIDICGYNTLTVEEFTRILLMLNLCGFSFSRD